ncbi:MAG: aspartate dehydrogenase [Nitrososphaerales archaeon]
MKNVGIIGCGTIGSELARAIDTGKIEDAALLSIFDIAFEMGNRLASKLQNKAMVAKTLDQFLQSNMDIVVEAASQHAVRQYAKIVLENDMDLMIMSVGALLDVHLYDELVDVATKHDVKIYLPTGAIAGIDAIRSVRHMLQEVTLTTTKNAKGLQDAPFFDKYKVDLKKIRKSTVIYEGNAIEAVKLFPANVNVAAILSLAGIGGKKTNVRIAVDPRSTMNVHEIMAKGKFGEMHFTVKNLPSPTNPKTSYLAVLSAIECLRSICNDRVNIGT